MKKPIYFILLFLGVSSFIGIWDQFQPDARPGGGSSYRSSSSGSRSSSSGSRSSSSWNRSSSSSGGSSFSNAASNEIAGFIGGIVLAFFSILILGQGMQEAGGSSKLILIGVLLALLGAFVAGLSKGFLYLFLMILFLSPFFILFMAFRKMTGGREKVFTVKRRKNER